MIEHLKSGLSISTHVGCNMGCSYCVLTSLPGFESGPKKDASPKSIVDALLSKRELFKDGETPLIINNRTDPLFPSVIGTTIELLERIRESGFVSPILLISKFPPCEQLSKFFNLLPLMYFYSYSNINTDFNYPMLNDHIKQISEYVPSKNRFHYFRPIIPGQNDNLQDMIECLTIFKQAKFRGSVITGLRINANNKKLISEGVHYDPHHKMLEKGLFSQLIQTVSDEKIDYTLYRHTSCAIASFVNKKCKLGYYLQADHCNSTCPNVYVCSEKTMIYKSKIIGLLSERFGDKIQYRFEGDKIVIDSPITQEEVAFLKNAFGIAVKANNMSLSPSERNITNHA